MGPDHAKPRPMHPAYPHNLITALVLAGGQGRRMGGRDKGLVDYQGQALVQHIVRILTPQCGHLLLSANRSHTAYQALGMAPLADLRPDFTGPLAGIETGLAACKTPYLLVCPCDTPHIPEDLGARLWSAQQQQNTKISYAADPERRHYLHLLLQVDSASDLSRYLDNGGRAVRHWLADKHPAEAAFSQVELANLNNLKQAITGNMG